MHGIILAYLYSLFVLPNNENCTPKLSPTIYPILYKGMIFIPYNDNVCIHVQHWVIYLIILILSFFIHISNILLGFCLGLFTHGLLYKDCYNFLCNNPY